jgi:signal transduction histidine kinase
MALADLLAPLRRLPTFVVDALLAAVVGGVTVVAIVVEANSQGPELRPIGWPLLALQIVPLAWRRRAPTIVVALTTAGAALYGARYLPDAPLMFGPLLAYYTVAAFRPRRVSVPVALVVMALAAGSIVFGDDADAADVAVHYFAGITAFVVGDTTRGQRERSAWLEERRVDAERRAVSDERIRIARDLHDVVAHHVSVIAVQAEAAQSVIAVSPERAEKAMADVADTARTALGELRRMLGVLRTGDGRAPQPDLAAVDDLVESVRRTGLAVTLRTSGPARPVGGLVGVAAYRVVQEALTNVVRHAGARQADVEVAFADGDLVITVADDGRRPAPSGSDGPGAAGPGRHSQGGFGIAGMRERVTTLGGDLDAGARPDGAGFLVRARLPLDAAAT